MYFLIFTFESTISLRFINGFPKNVVYYLLNLRYCKKKKICSFKRIFAQYFKENFGILSFIEKQDRIVKVWCFLTLLFFRAHFYDQQLIIQLSNRTVLSNEA